jgi:hypothetical protein
MTFIHLVESVIKILVFTLVVHGFYLLLVKFALRRDSQDILGGIIAKFFNIWLDVQNRHATDQQRKLMLAMHLFPASILVILIWSYLSVSVLVLNLIFCLMLIVSSTIRRY